MIPRGLFGGGDGGREGGMQGVGGGGIRFVFKDTIGGPGAPAVKGLRARHSSLTRLRAVSAVFPCAL
jgi:hypothetical protein